LISIELRDNIENMSEIRLLTVEEFATATGWKPSTIYQKVWRREVEFVRIGRSIRFKPEMVERLIDAGSMPVLDRGARMKCPNAA
jgi:excisionase family DNA binding protein